MEVALGKYLTVFLLISMGGQVLGQNKESYHFKQLSSEDGLVDNSITAIHQESRGFMWIGTVYGLSRYDAYTFKNFRFSDSDPSSISDNHIKCISDDTIPGNLWIGTFNGLNYYNKNQESFTRYLNQKEIDPLGSLITDIHFSKRWGLILATSNGMVFFDRTRTKRILHNPENVNSLCSNEILSISEDYKHRLWIGSLNGLDIYYPETNTFEHIQLKIQKDHPLYVYDIFENSEQDIVLSTRYHGLIILKNGTPTIKKRYDLVSLKLPGDYIEKTIETKNGYYWLSLRDGGLTRINPETDEIHIFAPDLSDPYSKSKINSKALTTVAKDIQENIWIGTYNSGVNVLDVNKKPFRHFKVTSRKDGLPNNNIRSLFQDSEGRIWIGTKEEGGLSEYILNKEIFIHYKKDPAKPNGLNDDYVFAIEELNKNILLIGTYRGGLNVFDKRTRKFTHFLHNPNTPRSDLLNAIYDIHLDRIGRIWIGTLKNLCLFDYNKKAFTLLDSIYEVRNILEDSQKRLWFASSKSGLLKLNEINGKFESIRLQTPDGKNVNLKRINHLCEDSKGNIWLATGETGLICLSSKDLSPVFYSSKNGLPSDQINAIIEDHLKNIWISSVSGLSRINPVSGKISNYQSYDGLEGNSFEKQMCLKLKSGELIFGGNNGFTIFQPEEIKENQFIPPVFITDLKIANLSVDFRNAKSPLQFPITETHSIVFKHDQVNITFEFAALNFSIPEKNRYKYFLEGFDNDWFDCGNERKAIYTNLDPGRYTFRIKASNNDGVWNEKGYSMAIKILPPFWNSWIAYVIYSIAMLIITNAVYQYFRLKESFRRDIIRERLQRKKEEELHEMKLKFFTNISHEFRTPLTLITAPLQQVLQNETVQSNLKETLVMVYRNALTLLQHINQLMDFRKIETSNTQVRFDKINVTALVKEQLTSFGLMAHQKEISLELHPASEEIEAYVDTEKFVSILTNLISNSLKYTGISGKVTVCLLHGINHDRKEFKSSIKVIDQPIEHNNEYYSIIIEDNGCGIKEEDLSNIFERYYRAHSESVGYNPGTGIGLSVVKSYMEFHRGNILLSSEPGVGTRFILQFPFEQKQGSPRVNSETEVFGDFFSESLFSQNGRNGIEIQEKDLYPMKIAGSKILIVEDNPDMLTFLKRNLSDHFDVSVAPDGTRGNEVIASNLPDLIISDIMMPGIDGITFCNSIKSDPRTCHIPVILLTAKNSVESRIEGIENGADAYISKPFDIRILKAQIINLILQRNRLKETFSRKIEVNPAEVTAHSLDEKLLQRALRFIEDNMSNPELSVEMMASELAMSRTNLHIKLKAITDQSTSEFIRVIRLKRAMQLLTTGGYNVNDVVYMVGFTSPSYFTKCFKNYFQKLPHECTGNKSFLS